MDATVLERIEGALVEDAGNGLYRCDRSIFTDPALFDLEMEHIFEGNWIYLAHESQLPGRNTYLTTWMGRQPVMLVRDKQEELHLLLNACSHRGAMLCRRKRGAKPTFTCPFHGWTFSNTGKLLKVKDPEGAGYPEQFNVEGSHDLKKIRLESYRGFLFGSLNPDVKPLAEHLGEAAKIIDMMVDQAPDGLEVLRGASTYYFDGNWKLQAENGADGYHVSAVHWNYVATTSRRKEAGQDEVHAMDASSWSKQPGGFYAFDNGHAVLWTRWADPTSRPMYAHLDELAQAHGRAKAEWMVENLRNLCLYPNLYLMDQFSSQLRVLRPISVNRTEVTIYCIAPKNEPAEQRTHRIRQYEDFFNASGMATPDDLEEFRACQNGYQGRAMRWNDMSRGAVHWKNGADANAEAIGLRPVLSGARTEDEGLFPLQHRYWADTLRKGLGAGGGQ